MITTGASQDIKSATNIAKKMIISWGMSNKLGFRNFYDNQGYYIDASEKVSEKTSEIIEAEIRAIMDECYAEVVSLMTKNRDKLEKIVQALMEHETLTGTEVKRIFDGEEMIQGTEEA